MTFAIKPSQPLDSQTERTLVLAARNGDENAYNALLASQIRYLRLLASRAVGERLEFDDCMGAAMEGFTVAVNTFPVDHGIRLTTHITHTVQPVMSELVAELTTMTPVAARTRRKYEEAIRKTTKNGRVDVDAAMAYAESVPDERSRMSRDTFMAVHAQLTGGVIAVEDEADYGPTTDIGFETTVVNQRWAQAALTGLDPQHRQILELAFGFGGQEPLSDGQIADVIGLSRSRVQALRTLALTEVRQTLADL